MRSHCSPNQLIFDGFETAFEKWLDPDNRWIVLSQLIPWVELSSAYNSYVKGLDIERPAVSTINGFIAHLTADEIISRINGYRIADNADFAIRRMVFTMGELLNEADDGVKCSVFANLVARGDAYPLLGLYMLAKAA